MIPKFLSLMVSIVLFSFSSINAQEESEVVDWRVKLQKLQIQRQQAVERLSKMITENPDRIEYYSSRGDLNLFLGRPKLAVADYDKMVELSPSSDASHWRRGIALFYAGEYQKAAAQFDRYHSFDDVDRENGIWRYLSHYKAYGKEKARQELLKYEKDDREPFPSVYKLFAGETTPEKILNQINAADLSNAQRESRMFYATLYIGLNHVVEENTDKAKVSLSKMLPNTWGPTAGYGPNYMWEVGRLQFELLQNQEKAN
ncbi:MAG: hypothetical protein P8M30_01470 [Planctomycetaceae bacterium]|nr:hypothetical protein [Planctomycetaceae bacterium]